MKFYSESTVLEEAKKRISFLFDEFDNVVVGFSGGKDSTATFNLALLEAEKRNRLPLDVIFVDQEAEWQGTIDYMREVMTDERVNPLWFQVPMVITNNASTFERYSYCWDVNKPTEWLREKEDFSIKENLMNCNRFHDMFGAILKHYYKDQKTCYLAGVRAEEAPKRLMSLTTSLTYKDITWGKVLDKKQGHYTFYPLYDWSYTDIWKFIQENNIKYNRIYDEMFKHNVKINDMRISNLHHETAIQALLLVQEIEPETWNKVAKRISGSNAIKHLKSEAFKCPDELPYMFKSWEEYVYHLNDKLVLDKKYHAMVLNKIEKSQKYLISKMIIKDFYKTMVKTILSSDFDFTKLANFQTSQDFQSVKAYINGRYKESKEKHYMCTVKYNKYLKEIL